jgi:hypothetical protein
VLDTILFPVQLPSYIIPTISINGNLPSSPVEVGSVQSISFKPKGVKWDAGAFQAFRVYRKTDAGSFTQQGADYTSLTSTDEGAFGTEFGFADPNSNNFSYTTPSNFTQSLTIGQVASGTSITYTYKVGGTYNAGLAKKTSRNVNDPTTLALRTTTAPQLGDLTWGFESATKSLTAIYPYFWGVSSASTLSASDVATIINGATGANKVIAPGSGTVTINFGASNQFLWFAIWDGYTPVKNTYKDWNNFIASIGGVGSAWNSPVSQSVISYDGYWTKTYKIYISVQKTNTSGNIDFYTV